MLVNNKIEFVNTLRGFAAICVVISHYLSAFWYKRDSIAKLINAPLLTDIKFHTPTFVIWLNQFSLFDWGSFGVGLFFIISGFVIPFSLQRNTAFGFCVSRFLRIVPTYIVGFSITLLALYLGSIYFLSEWPYTYQEIIIHLIPGVRDVLDSRTIDVIIWTLEIEMKFYLIVALTISWFQNYSFKVFLIPIAFFLFTCYLSTVLSEWSLSHFAAFIWARIYMMCSPYIIFMFIGVFFHYLYCQKIEINKGYLGIGGLFCCFCIAWWSGPNANNLILAWSYAFSILVFMFAYSFPYYFKNNPIFNFFAAISYPLYIIHSVAGYIALRILLNSGIAIWVSLIIVVITAIIISYLLHLFIETPFNILGKKLSTIIREGLFKKLKLLRLLKSHNFRT